MGELTSEGFEDWLHPSDLVEHFYQQGLGNDGAKARVVAMLSDGLLRAGAKQLIVNGIDRGHVLVPRDIWPAASRTNVWVSGDFRLAGSNDGRPWSISAYDVRIDPEEQRLPRSSATHSAPVEQPRKPLPLPDARLTAWAELFFATYPNATEATARQSLNTLFPDHIISRERLRTVLPNRRRGRPAKSQDGD